MKHVFALLATLFFAYSASAGTTYQFDSTTEGMASVKMAAKVEVDGPKARIDFTGGDGMMFKNGTVALTSDGGKTMTVLDPDAKTYYTLKLEDLLGGKSLLGGLGQMMKLSFENPTVNVQNAGAGEAIEGYPTHKTIMKSGYDIAVDMMGQKMSMRVDMTMENWLTDKISADAMSAFQLRGFRTGVDAVDKLIDAQKDALKGFPLKQVITTTMKQPSGSEIKTVTTTLVHDIATKPVAAAEFDVPAGYKKTQSPLEKMMQSMQHVE